MNLELHLDFPGLSEQEQALIREVLASIGTAIEQFSDLCNKKTVNVVLTSEDYIQSLNQEFRNKDAATDVLSFPLSTPDSDDHLLGEIYISWPRVGEQATEYGHSLRRELAWLVVHGILHLLGYEHGNLPDPEMRAKEEDVLRIIDAGR